MRTAVISCQARKRYLAGGLYNEDQILLEFIANKWIKVARVII